MPTKKKKKYNARFPPARIKKIMQSNEEVGKVAAAVPVIISRAVELFVDTLMANVNSTLNERGARTMTSGHLKLCIHSVQRFDFLKDLVADIADLQGDIDIDQNEIPPTSNASSSSSSQSDTSSHPESSSSRQTSELRLRHRLSRKNSYESMKPKQPYSSRRYVDDLNIDLDSEDEIKCGQDNNQINEESQKARTVNDLINNKETYSLATSEEEAKHSPNPSAFHKIQGTQEHNGGQFVPKFTITPLSLPSSSTNQTNGNFSMSAILKNDFPASNILIGGTQLQVDEDYDA